MIRMTICLCMLVSLACVTQQCTGDDNNTHKLKFRFNLNYFWLHPSTTIDHNIIWYTIKGFIKDNHPKKVDKIANINDKTSDKSPLTSDSINCYTTNNTFNFIYPVYINDSYHEYSKKINNIIFCNKTISLRAKFSGKNLKAKTVKKYYQDIDNLDILIKLMNHQVNISNYINIDSITVEYIHDEDEMSRSDGVLLILLRGAVEIAGSL